MNRTRAAQLLVLLVIVGVSLFASSKIATTTVKSTALALYHSQVSICESSNQGRIIANSHTILNERELKLADTASIGAAAAARRSAYAKTHQPYDLLAARKFEGLVARLDRLKFPTYPLLDCKAIKKP